MADGSRRTLVAMLVVLIGVVLLIVSLFTPWYTTEASGDGITASMNFYPGLPTTNGTIQYVCSGTGVPCPSSTSYSDYGINNTGRVAETGYFLIIAGIVFGLLAVILALLGRRKPGRGRAAVAVTIIAVILAIAAPGAFAVELPHAISQDYPGATGTGPWSSFFGSNSTTESGFTLTSTWGPAIGWYLSIGAFVVLWVGVILLLRQRKEPVETASVPPQVATSSNLPGAPTMPAAPGLPPPPPMPPGS